MGSDPRPTKFDVFLLCFAVFLCSEDGGQTHGEMLKQRIQRQFSPVAEN